LRQFFTAALARDSFYRTTMNDTAHLLADEATWQRTFDAVPDLIFVLDHEHRIVRANRAAAERLGCSAEELVGQCCYAVAHGTDRPPDFCPHSQLLRDGQAHTAEVYEPRVGGHFAVSVTPLTNGRGETIGAVHVARDITELKRIEAELRSARDLTKQRHALAVAAMLDGLWEWDLTTDCVLYSDRYLEVLGYPREETSGTIDFFKDILHPEDAPAVWEAVERTLADKSPHEIEFRLRSKTGEYRWFLSRGQVQWDADGKPTRMAGVIQDITSQKQAKEAWAERARFDGLLADLSACFVGVLPERLDAEIAQALEQVRDFFGIDRLAFLKYLDDSALLVHPSHLACGPGISPIDAEQDARVLFPWAAERVRFGEPFTLYCESLPPEAVADRASFERYGIRCAAVIPISIVGTPAYVFALGSGAEPRSWPADLLLRLRVLGEIIVGALTRRETERQLSQAEFNYRTLADFSNDWEYWQDVDGSFRYISPSCERITGYTQQEFLDQPSLMRDIVIPEDRPCVDQHRNECCGRPGCCSQPGTQRLEFRIRRRDGQIAWLGHACRPVIDEQGKWLGTRVSTRDLTDRKLAEQSLEAAYAEIAELKERLEKENEYLQDEIKHALDFEEIVGRSETLRITLHKIGLVADTEATVLLLGETGTGKELLARAIHQRSPRSGRPLVKVNCAALPSSLIESELFGHVRGAFTGALADKAGRFEIADGGTLFLDEIGELEPELQAKLLRVLQDGEFERIGSLETRRVDVRVIAATNRDLQRAMNEGTFRPDLYYRLSVFPIEVPPLRVRRDDIPLLVWHFVTCKQRRLGKSIKAIPPDVMAELVVYDWPGNVRELDNVIERAMILSPGATLVLSESLSGAGAPPAPQRHWRAEAAVAPEPVAVAPSRAAPLTEVDRAHIMAVLDDCGWKIKGAGNAAERLGLKPSTLRFRMKKLGIQRRPKPR
jgi:formate hydrogenlyase transcriptional activator